MDFSPFRPLHPSPELASRLVSPPYDVMSTPEARAIGSDPISFLRVTRSELELADGQDPYAPEVYARAAANLAGLVASEALVRAARPSYAIYRQTRGAHAQIGIVGLSSVAEYEAGLVKKHELTRAEKEDDRTRHIDVTSAQTGPVFLAIRGTPALRELMVHVTLTRPDLDAWMANGVRHEAWLVPADSPRGEELRAFMAAEPASYIADGHHRAASAARVSKLRRERGAGPGPWDHFLTVVFPADWLAILPYNRVIPDLAACGTDAATLLATLSERFEVGPPGASPVPSARHRVSLWLDGAWREVVLGAHGDIDESDPIASLDVAIVQNAILEPLLGITDPRRDHRIDFVGGIRGTTELEVRAGRTGLAISMFPTSMDELFAVADQGLIMPPKSTWFEPKLADGLFLHTI